MDGRRFDSLARLVGQGASRRTILKGLLGLGGAAVAGQVATDSSDARTARTRPTIPPPPPPTTPALTTTTPAPCPGQEQCPDSTLCCDPGTCARSGNTAICCAGAVCGLECCDSPAQCCDRECCPTGSVCIGEEFCCSRDRICESAGTQCCSGTQECCEVGGCCDGACVLDAETEREICCLASRYCAITGECCDAGSRCCADEGCCVGTCFVDEAEAERCCPSASSTLCGSECCDNDSQSCCADANGNLGCLDTLSCPTTTTTTTTTSTTVPPTTTTTPAPVPCLDNKDCTEQFQVCCDGFCEYNFVCNCKDCIAAGNCSSTPGCCDAVEDCGPPESCRAKSCNQHICVAIGDCRQPLGDERCCNVGLICNEEFGFCEQDMSCDPPCTGDFIVCCEGTCMENFRCNCKDCIAAGDCSSTPGCCEEVEDCGPPESCTSKSCIEHICVAIGDCRQPLGDERCCNVGLICNEEFGFCEQDMSCDPPCTGDFIVCCEGTCMENFRCNCKDCIAAGNCSSTPGCCDAVEDCGPPESCRAKFCNQHICVAISDCREPLGDEDCCDPGLVCNQSTGSCSPAVLGSEMSSETACVPVTTCAPDQCGAVDDGCGNTIDCGDCPTTPAPCDPGTCASLGGGCGQSVDDGCGTMIYCGDCPATTAPDAGLAAGERCSDDSHCGAGLLCRGRRCDNRGRRTCRDDCAA